ADEVGPVAREAIDLSRALQPRTLRGRIDAARRDFLVAGDRRVEDALTHQGRIRLGENDVAHRNAGALREGRRPGPGVVDDLVRYDQRARPHVLVNAADRGDGNHLLRARLLERPDIGAIVHFVRRDAVTVAVARKEHDLLVADATEAERGRCITVGRV